MHDPFVPHKDPAKSIYLAFQLEAANRKGRSPAEWIKAEREAVHAAAMMQAERLGLSALSLQEIEAAERYAMGSVDYGAKWAYQVVDAMRRKNSAATSAGN